MKRQRITDEDGDDEPSPPPPPSKRRYVSSVKRQQRRSVNLLNLTVDRVFDALRNATANVRRNVATDVELYRAMNDVMVKRQESLTSSSSSSSSSSLYDVGSTAAAARDAFERWLIDLLYRSRAIECDAVERRRGRRQFSWLPTDECYESKVYVSPVLILVPDEELTARKRCVSQWLLDDALVTAANSADETPLSVRIAQSTLAGTITETVIRRERAQTIETRSNDDTFAQFRTQYIREFNVLSCTAINKYLWLNSVAIQRFIRELEDELAIETRRQRDVAIELALARRKLAAIRDAVDNDRRLIQEAHDEAERLADGNAALLQALANAEEEARTRELMVLHAVREDIEKKMALDPKTVALENEITSTRERITELTEASQRVASELSRFLPTLTATTTVDLDAAAVETHMLRAADMCQSAGAMILTTNLDVDEITTIATQCEPLRRLKALRFLAEAKDRVREQEARAERLHTVTRRAVSSIAEYAKRMYDYLTWIQCREKAEKIEGYRCTDDETIKVYRSASAMRNIATVANIPATALAYTSQPIADNAFPRRAVKYVFANNITDSVRKMRTSAVVHVLVTEAFGCRVPLKSVIENIVVSTNVGRRQKDVDFVLEWLQRWPIGYPRPEKRGLVLATLMALAPPPDTFARLVHLDRPQDFHRDKR